MRTLNWSVLMDSECQRVLPFTYQLSLAHYIVSDVTEVVN